MYLLFRKTCSYDQGAPAIDARVVIGAMIIKHKLKLDDRETIKTIRENMYMQYFLGLEEYTYEDVFDRSLFIALRYRLGADKFDAMTRQIILTSEGKHEAARNDLDENQSENQIQEKSTEEVKKIEKPKENKGTLIVDATVADQMIAYPTDLGLLSRSREESERIIDELCNMLNINEKPRTYRRLARKQYLNVAMKKNKTRNELRKAIGGIQ